MPSVAARPRLRRAGPWRIARIIGLSLLLTGAYALHRLGPSAFAHWVQ